MGSFRRTVRPERVEGGRVDGRHRARVCRQTRGAAERRRREREKRREERAPRTLLAARGGRLSDVPGRLARALQLALQLTLDLPRELFGVSAREVRVARDGADDGLVIQRFARAAAPPELRHRVAGDVLHRRFHLRPRNRGLPVLPEPRVRLLDGRVGDGCRNAAPARRTTGGSRGRSRRAARPAHGAADRDRADPQADRPGEPPERHAVQHAAHAVRRGGQPRGDPRRAERRDDGGDPAPDPDADPHRLPRAGVARIHAREADGGPERKKKKQHADADEEAREERAPPNLVELPRSRNVAARRRHHLEIP
jgi:hypothetical protein